MKDIVNSPQFKSFSKHVYFLDLDLSLTHTGISIDIFEKSQNLYLYLPQYSCHSTGVKFDTIFGIEGKNTKIKERYPAQRDSRQSLGSVVTDYWFRCASQRVAGDLQTLLGKDVVSMYWYNHSVSFGPEMWPKYNFPFCVNKVCHGAELPFVFHNSANWTLDGVELKLSDYMVDSWSDFIKHDDASLRARGWFGFNETGKKVMALQPNSMIQSTTGTGLCTFWDGIGYDH